jgi:fused signal recognition particle receptor
MFKFLKKKLSKAVENMSKKVEELPVDDNVKESSKEVVKKSEQKKTIFTEIKKSILTKKITESEFDDLFWELELILLENSVAIEVIEKIKTNLKMDLVGIPIERKKIKTMIEKTLNEIISGLFKNNDFDLVKSIKNHTGPYIIVFVGVNGSGKTTSIAKVAKMLKSNGLSCVLSAADTFRAAAIEQLEIHGEKLGIDVIKHKYGVDAAAVAFDSIQYAKSKKLDVVLIDTAGRLHSNINLMGELKKIIKVSKPDLKVFVGESITGNDCVEQAVAFNENIELDGIILSKADIDEKGGAAISISYVTGKPIFYFGTGQNYGDLEKFNIDKFFSNLGL